MISIIICSRYSNIPQSLKDNIAETIGVEYELIVIDNSTNKYSIFSAYNEGARRSKYPYLCFMHDDVLYHTQDWGKNVVLHFDDEKVGLIGVAGCHFLQSTPAYWFDSPYVTRTHIQTENGVSVKGSEGYFFNDTTIVEAVGCDGFLLCIRHSLFSKISFDEITYSGFHYYDMDICMQVIASGYSVCICNDITIEHFGSANFNSIYYENQQIFVDKWKNYLPIQRGIQLPEDAFQHINRYIVAWYLKDKEIQRIVNSKAYRLGKFLLRPFYVVKSLFSV